MGGGGGGRRAIHRGANFQRAFIRGDFPGGNYADNFFTTGKLLRNMVEKVGRDSIFFNFNFLISSLFFPDQSFVLICVFVFTAQFNSLLLGYFIFATILVTSSSVNDV